MLKIIVCVILFLVRSILTITGGTRVETMEKRPYQVAINVNYTRYWHADCPCGGTIISQNFILTAAHCLKKPDPKYYVIRVGALESEWWGSIYDVKELILHPKYTLEHLRYDMALMRLEKNIQFTKIVQPIPMVDVNFTMHDFAITKASGYGAELVNGKALGYLKEIQLGTVEWEYCRTFYDDLLENQICANATESRNDTGISLILFKYMIIQLKLICTDASIFSYEIAVIL